MSADQRLPGAARIASSREIREIFRTGRRVRSGPLELVFRRSSTDRPRFTVVVPRHGHTIVARNKLRRRLSEILRRDWLPEVRGASPAMDLIARPGPAAYDSSFEQLRSAVHEGLEAISWPDASSSR